MKAVFHLKPALPRYNITWDPQVVLKYIVGLGPNKRQYYSIIKEIYYVNAASI